MNLHSHLDGKESITKFSPTLARGLGYYTGTILEVKVNNVKIGSVSGGGRYDDLTGIFGLPNVSGVGFSFGVDRLYDVLDELDAFPKTVSQGTTILIAHFDDKSFSKGLEVLKDLRNAGIRTEIFPELSKLKKQLQFADKKNIPFSIIIGDNEIKSSKWQLRDMHSGNQESLSTEEVIKRFKAND